MEFPERVEGLSLKTFHGRGKDNFWNNTISKTRWYCWHTCMYMSKGQKVNSAGYVSGSIRGWRSYKTPVLIFLMTVADYLENIQEKIYLYFAVLTEANIGISWGVAGGFCETKTFKKNAWNLIEISRGVEGGILQKIPSKGMIWFNQFSFSAYLQYSFCWHSLINPRHPFSQKWN